MNPNDVKEMLKTIIEEKSLPITTYQSTYLLIVEGEYPGSMSERYAELEQCLERIIQQWKGDRALSA